MEYIHRIGARFISKKNNRIWSIQGFVGTSSTDQKKAIASAKSKARSRLNMLRDVNPSEDLVIDWIEPDKASDKELTEMNKDWDWAGYPIATNNEVRST